MSVPARVDRANGVDEQMVLPDGRTLGWLEAGDPDGLPVLVFHGTPSSRLDALTLHGAARAAGVRIIAPDRPGIGLSTFQPGRRILDWSADVAALAGHLRLEQMSVLGYSGGGPYALACAREVPGLLQSVAVVSGCGPVDRPENLYDTGTVDLVLTLACRWAPWFAGAVFRGMDLVARRLPGVATEIWLADLTPEERAEARPTNDEQDGPPFEFFTESMRHGPDGVIVDYRLLAEPWGFLPEEVTAPVEFWHGDADRIVPLHEAVDLRARVAGSNLRVVSGGGHLMLHAHAADIFGELASSGR